MIKICVFSGTRLGRKLIERLSKYNEIQLTCCVATAYGESLIENISGEVLSGRLSEDNMVQLFLEKHFDLVIDATHPYATEVTENIINAASQSKIEYLRLNRENVSDDNLLFFDSAEQIAEYLRTTTGNILFTTGSKDLDVFASLPDFDKRAYVRVLPMQSSIEKCVENGVSFSKIIAMQGPFGYALNKALIEENDIKYIVTKQSGEGSGYEEKISAALDLNAVPLILGVPKQVEGFTYGELIALLIKRFNLTSSVNIKIVGLGVGAESYFTEAAKSAIRQSDVVFGASRLAESAKSLNHNIIKEYKANEIQKLLSNNPQWENVSIVVSGDVGFFSAATSLVNHFSHYKTELICGISTPIYFSAKTKIPWQNMKLISVHGRNCNMIYHIKRNKYTFMLTGGDMKVRNIVDKLMHYSLGNVTLYIGEELSSDNEKITISKAEEIIDRDFSSLSAVIIENNDFITEAGTSLSDEAYIREKSIPMTKSEVRALSVAKLNLCKDSVIYDIGAGSGSVSIEMANAAYEGIVFAIERKVEAAELIEKNKIKHCADNITVVQGFAPEASEDLPIPTHAFIGGSMGNLRDIIKQLLNKNPDVKIVINAVTLETLAEVSSVIKEFSFDASEIVCVNISRSKTLGNYHLFDAQNPVYIIKLNRP